MYNIPNKLGFKEFWERYIVANWFSNYKIKYLCNDEESRYIFLYKGGRAID
jgi:hypothetical protein